MPEQLDSRYNPASHEKDIYTKWESAGIFQPQDEAVKTGKKPFVIMLPPPNITGSLHMGHAMQDTIMDVLIRFHRMLGEPTLWLPGTDHAAIATNRVIEKQLHEEGKTRYDIGRDAFMQRTQEWYEKTGAVILDQMKRLGVSSDWSRLRFTMDEKYYAAVQESFVRYYNKGLIYRGARLVNWDPATQTTVSDLEIEWKKETVPFYTFQYGPFQISTARPETKFGDKYVVMHPDDERYVDYKHGDTFECEWITGKVTATVIKDDSIDPTFGTGVMTITPWHDATDFEIAKRHKLDMEPIIGLDGKLLPIAGEFFGTDIRSARGKVVETLQDKGLVVSVEEKYEHNIAVNERGGGVLEPQVMRQWFVNMQELKKETIEVAEKELVKFLPSRWKHHFIEWMNNVYDWNISRQIWLGHRIPVWWKKGTRDTDQEDGNFVVSIEKPEGDWEQDPDVLDTWFSSALWPFATLGWPDATDDLKTFYPTSVLVTGRDILYLWVARMIFSGLELLKDEQYEKKTIEDRIPFSDVFIYPTVLAKSGQRMSKSLGTGIDPLELIEQYGADATRFGLMYQMSYDQQALKFDEEAIRSARNFANKLWNIMRLLDSLPDRDVSTIADEWIASSTQDLVEKVTDLIEAYRFGEASHEIYDFVWKDFADWYMEILKNEGSVTVARESFKTITHVLHPFMPFITEVLWEYMEGEGLLAAHSWPYVDKEKEDATTAEEQMNHFKQVVNTIRSSRILFGIKPSETIRVYIPGEIILHGSLATMTKSEIQAELTEDMHRIPLGEGSFIAIGSPQITTESIANAKAKLHKEESQLKQSIVQISGALKGMYGKASEAVISEKESLIRQQEGRLTEIEKSLSLLT